MGDHVNELVLGLFLLRSPFKRYVFSSKLCERCSDDAEIRAEHSMISRDPQESTDLSLVFEFTWVVPESCNFSWVDCSSVF